MSTLCKIIGFGILGIGALYLVTAIAVSFKAPTPYVIETAEEYQHDVELGNRLNHRELAKYCDAHPWECINN
jgi:hypothetical protein